MEQTRSFKCCVCDNSLKEPIMLVPNLGDVCGACYNVHYESKGWKGVHNVTLERTLRKIITTCKFRPEGCIAMGNYNDLLEHQEKCEYRPVKCPISSNCGYRRPLKELAHHLVSKHGSNVITKYRNWFQFPIVATDTNIFKLLVGSSESCFLQISKDENNFMLCSAYGGAESDFGNVLTIEFRGKVFKDIECKILPLSHLGKEVNVAKIGSEEISMDLVFVVIKYRKAGVDSATLKYGECSFCFNLMSGVIMECQNGHNFCESCWKKIVKCPVCSILKEDGSYCRNEYLEGLIEKKLHTCRNRESGCLVTFLVKDDATVHESCCSLKPSTCPVCGTKNNLLDILTHFRLKHKFNELQSKKFYSYHNTSLKTEKLCEQSVSEPKDFIVNEYLMINNNVFLLTAKQLDGKLMCNVDHLLKNYDNVNFGYKIRLTSATFLDSSIAKTNQCNEPVYFQWSDLQVEERKNYLLELYCEIDSNVDLLSSD